MVHGSSPCGPTNSKAAHCAAFAFLAYRPHIQSNGPSDRDRRLSPEEEHLLLAAVNRHSNPMLG
ncbi:hypothetical protein F3K53_11880 [Pseudomonas veronii]|uniref:Uncharacterized protein n=1 Tax=Pseudomonas veronii TaxID=76761 RepID=A0A5M8FI59_PSEVE|nr:hypothetical protein F3K54_09750 [Pseudomonas veronii]KAA6180622.1 hypothetical protein F3K53_11880 [Pseudomonas veronii]